MYIIKDEVFVYHQFRKELYIIIAKLRCTLVRDDIQPPKGLMIYAALSCVDDTAYLDNYAVEAMSENRQYIDGIEEDEELTALFDELEADEDEEE